jgi:hypothetical protein
MSKKFITMYNFFNKSDIFFKFILCYLLVIELKYIFILMSFYLIKIKFIF